LKRPDVLVNVISTQPVDPVMNGLATNSTLVSPLSIETTQGAGAWKFSNYLTINNSINNLIGVINQSGLDGLCDAGLNGDGADITNILKASPWYPKEALNQDVKIFLGIDILQRGSSLCGALPIGEIEPENTIANYRIQLQMKEINETSDQKKSYCEARGSLTFNKDNNPPLSAVRILGAGTAGAGLCGNNPVTGVAKQGVPSACVPAVTPTADIQLEVTSFKDTAVCRTCLENVYSIADDGIFPITRAEAINGTCSAPRDAISACWGQCQPTDPGSVLFCRIGEKNWINGKTAGNPANDWRPCHLAPVYDFNGAPIAGATVSITYGGTHPVDPGNPAKGVYAGRDMTQSDLSTWAKITVSGVPAERAYQFDVRAVDTGGLFVGPSFCGVAGVACTPESGYGVAVAKISDPPGFGSVRSVGNFIAKADERPVGQIGYDDVLMPTFPGNYQCQAGPFNLTSTVVDYAEESPFPIPTGMGIENCQLNMTLGAAGALGCACNNNGACLAEGSTANISQKLSAGVVGSDECSGAPGAPSYTFNWCQDVTAAFNIKKGVLPTDFFDVENPGDVNLAGTVKSPAEAGKDICGLSYAVPVANFADDLVSTDYTGAYGAAALPAMSLGVANYNPMTHSGCMSLGPMLDDTTEHNGICIQAVDPCGRTSGETSVKMGYGVYLATSTPDNLTTFMAQQGIPVPYKDGNQCNPGAYAGCSAVGQRRCYSKTACENYNQDCQRNWNEATVNPGAAEVCYDSMADDVWATFGVAEKKAIA
ncbi:MAG: hypothetical protein KDD40_08645, partial [Bdellovibrionales bacterium]|nr:hypothetical protein [Bdellovibrionales bacterium]